jgi:hypothetical protein
MKTTVIFCLLCLVSCTNKLIAQDKVLTFGFLYENKIETKPYIIITEVVPGGAAEKAKIKSGDTLIAINKENVAAKSNADITQQIIIAKQKERLEIAIKGKLKIIALKPLLMNRYSFVKKPDAAGKAIVKDNFTLWSYDGDYKEGSFNGKGVYTFFGKYKNYPANSFIKQAGNFINGTFTDGVTYFKNGDSFEGKIKNNRPNGQGIYTASNGTKYSGNFDANGYFDGVFKVTDAQNNVTEQIYQNGVQVAKYQPKPIDIKTYDKKRFTDQLVKIVNNQGNQFEDIKGESIASEFGNKSKSTVTLEGFGEGVIINYKSVSKLFRYEAETVIIKGKANALAFLDVLDKEVQKLIANNGMQRVVDIDAKVRKRLNYIFTGAVGYDATEIKFLQLDAYCNTDFENPDDAFFTVTIRADKPAR